MRVDGMEFGMEFDLNTLRVDGESFESGKKKLRIQKYADTCRRGLKCSRCQANNDLVYFSFGDYKE